MPSCATPVRPAWTLRLPPRLRSGLRRQAREGARPHTFLEAVRDADTYVVIVLTASSGIDVQVGNSGVEIARFEPRAPSVPYPHI